MADSDVQIKVCQQEIVKLDLQVKAIIQDVRDCDGPIERLHELNGNIRDVVTELKSRIQELEGLANEQDKETDKIALQKDADNHKKQLARMQTTLRQANLNCHLAIERREKEYLLGNKPADETTVRKRGKSDKEQLASTASSITENLMSISRMMASQVQRSDNTISTLVSSSKQLSDTNEEFKSMTGHIQNSRKLITKYGRREITDKLLIFLALAFFFATVLYIMKKRLF